MFKSGGGKDADILKQNEDQILFYVDLENECFIDKEGGGGDENMNEEGELEVQGSRHPVLMNKFPVCKNHALFLLFAQEGLP